MGILDELRQQTCEKKEREYVQKSHKKQLDDNYEQIIAPKMQQIFVYMKEIVDHVNYIDLTLEVSDYSKRFPQFGTLTQKKFKINTDGIRNVGDTDHLAQINLTSTCEGKGNFSYHLEGKNKIEEEIAFLHLTKVPFRWRYDLRKKIVDTGIFTITRKIPVLFKFEVDLDISQIKVIIKNHESFTVHKESFLPEEIDEDFLDKIARYLLRKDRELVMLDISPEQRQAIKAMTVEYKNLSDKIKHLFGNN